MANRIHSFFANTTPERRKTLDKYFDKATIAVETVTPSSVFKKGSRELRLLADALGESLMLPGSRMEGAENLFNLLACAKKGESCLLLVEHYGNLDLTNICALIDKLLPDGPEFCDRLIAMAGIKLSNDPFAAAWSQAYNRLVIYPAGAHLRAKTEEERTALLEEMTAINMASMAALAKLKKEGNIVLLFPSGTRMRPWDPATTKGVKEVAGYLKGFDKMLFVSLNGNTLVVNEGHNMGDDQPVADVVILSAEGPYSCKEFIADVAASLKEGDDRKEAIVDKVMATLKRIHDKIEISRKQELDRQADQRSS